MRKPFEHRIWLSSPTMGGMEETFVKEAFATNWVSTIGKNIDELEQGVCQYLGEGFYSVALSSGTAALHLAVKLAGVRRGDRVFCSNTTFAATVNPVLYEGAKPVFIESEEESFNMSPKALREAFQRYPDTKCVIVADLYGVPAKLFEIKSLCEEYGAILIEDAAEAFGAAYKGKKAGSFGNFNIISFNGNKIITTSGGGMLISSSEEEIRKAKFLSTQARESYPWYEHREIGYNYRLSNVLAGIGRGQLLYLDEYVERKKAIYERYRNGFQGLPLSMNPIPSDVEPNYWLSCLLIDKDRMAIQDRTRFSFQKMKPTVGTNTFLKREEAKEPLILSPIEKQIRDEYREVDFKGKMYLKESGKTSPEEMREALEALNIESRPIWKPMRLHSVYAHYDFVTKDGSIRDLGEDYVDVDSDLFHRGLCLPSDIKMKPVEQDVVIEVIQELFR